MSVDLGPLKVDLFQAAHRAGVSPSVLVRKAIATFLDSTASESGVEVSQPGPVATVERGKLEDKVLEVRVKLHQKDARRASDCARAEGLSRSEYLAMLVGEAMRGVARRAGTSANRGGLGSRGPAGPGWHAGGTGRIDIPDRGARAQCESDRPIPERKPRRGQ